MTCVTAADLGRPIAAIVQRCGAPLGVMSLSTKNTLMYSDGQGHGVSVDFDPDQMRVRTLLFFTMPPRPNEPFADWTVTLPFASGASTVALGQLTLARARSAFAADADVSGARNAAFRSSEHTDVVLAADDNGTVRAAFVGERMALQQDGVIAAQPDDEPLDYTAPVPRDAWLKGDGSSGPQATIVRIDVDAAGIVRNVVVVVPSGDAAFDAALQTKIGDARFRPATIENRPVSGAYFAQVRH